MSCLQVLLRNKAGFLATRACLGLAEAGYIPGAMYTLSNYYTAPELTKRIAIFFFGMFGGTAISPLVGAGLLKLDGKANLSGWQWIFLGKSKILVPNNKIAKIHTVEGLFSIVVSIVLLILLPECEAIPQTPSCPSASTTTMDVCSQKDHLAEPRKAGIPLKLVWDTLSNIEKWPHFIATACVFSTWSPLTTYTPSIIMKLGFTRIQANSLAAIGSFGTLPVILLFAWLSDKTNKRGLTVMVAISVYLIALVVLRTIENHVGKWSKFGLWTTANGLAVGYHPIHNAWIQMNCQTPEERSISVA